MADYSALPIFTDAWIADTAHLERAERGLYFDLLVLIWRSPECRVPNDLAWISRKLRCLPDEQSALSNIVDEFCQKTGNWITQKRLRKEWEYVRDRVEKRRASAKSRWNKEEKPCERIKDEMRSECVGNAPTPTPTPSDIEPDGSIPPESPKPKKSTFVLPPDIPAEPWEGFEEMRRKIRKPMTDRARALIVNELRKLAEDGHPPGKVLEQSIMHDWQGVFRLKDRNDDRPRTAQPAGSGRSAGAAREDAFATHTARAVEAVGRGELRLGDGF